MLNGQTFVQFYPHHHQVAQLAQISQTLSLSPIIPLTIASGRSSSLHSASIQSCCKYVLLGRPIFARQYEWVHRRMLQMISFLLLQECPACLIRLTCVILELGGRWLYNCCFVGCCFQDLINTTCIILVQLLSNFFSIRFVEPILGSPALLHIHLAAPCGFWIFICGLKKSPNY